MSGLRKYSGWFNRYPVVRQLDKSDCGPASLLSVLKYFGGQASLWYIRELCRTGLHGTTFYDMIEAAKKLGLSAAGVKGSYTDLRNEKLPVIAHVLIDTYKAHFIVIYRVNKESLIVMDPSKGRKKLARDTFEMMWKSGFFILFDSSGHPASLGSFSLYRWFVVYLKQQSVWIGQALFLGLVFTLSGLLTAFFIQQLIDRFIPDARTERILTIGGLLLFLFLLRAAAGYVREKFLIVLNKRFSTSVNADIIKHLFKLPLKFFDSRRKGDITSRIHDIIKIQQFIYRLSGSTLTDLIIIAGSLIFIFFYSNEIGLCILLFMPFYSGLLLLHNRSLKREQHNVMQSFARVESVYIDSLNGIDTILSYHAADKFSKTNTLIYGHFQEKVEKLGKIRNRLRFFSEISATFISVFVLIYGALLVVKYRLLLGEMIAAYSLLSYLLPAISRFVELNISLQGAVIAMRRLFEFIVVEKEQDKGEKAFNLQKALRLENIRFKWAADKILFKKIDLVIPRGKMVSLWGPNGAGKSTLARLIQRKYKPDEGRLMLDDCDVRQIILKDYRDHVTLVPENITIFWGTLAENILLGRSYSIHDLKNLLGKHGLHTFLDRFEKGFYTLIGEEFRILSAGEKQVVGLLRALLGDPSLIIIDEGFNTLDHNHETLIFTILQKFARTNAVLIITHNINIIMKTDFIYVLDHGTIVQEGAPFKLLQSPGILSTVFKGERGSVQPAGARMLIKQRGDNSRMHVQDF